MTLPPLPWGPLLAGGPIWELINKWYDASAGDVATHAADQIDAAIRTYAEQYGRLCAEAERDRLQARVAELEAALAAIAEGCSFPADDVQRAVRDRARAAIDTARKAKP